MKKECTNEWLTKTMQLVSEKTKQLQLKSIKRYKFCRNWLWILLDMTILFLPLILQNLNKIKHIEIECASINFYMLCKMRAISCLWFCSFHLYAYILISIILYVKLKYVASQIIENIYLAKISTYSCRH